jgi:hypothetical protein
MQWIPGVNRPGHEADHSPPASAEVKKMWIPLPNMPSWHSAELDKHRDNFIFRGSNFHVRFEVLTLGTVKIICLLGCDDE